MRTRHRHRLLAVSTLCALLAGCAASNPVYKLDENDVPDRIRGATFYLPRTRLTLQFVETTLTYRTGVHTPLVEACATSAGFTPGFCDRLTLLGIESLRPPHDAACDTAAGTKRVSFKAFVLESAPVPDYTQGYVVDLRRNWFQDFEFALDLDAYGVVGKGRTKTVERASQDVLDFGLGVLERSMGARAAAPAAPAAAVTLAARNTLTLAQRGALSAAERDALDDLARLEHLLTVRGELTAALSADVLSRTEVALTRLNSEIALLTAKFTGKLTVKDGEPQKIAYLPPTKVVTAHDATLRTYDHCGGTGTSDKLVLRLTAVEPGVAVPSIDVTTVDDDVKGWPHRVPALMSAEAGGCINGACAAMTPIGDVGIAQFGHVMRLPAKTGGRSADINVTYSPLGSLTAVTVSQAGQDATPIFATLDKALAEAPETPSPTEQQQLDAQFKLIKARQDLCKLIYGANDERCAGPNPPVE